jgi:broad specificity phosphatase PhoE
VQPGQGDFVLYLFRHAEKASDGSDPDLTDYGRARAAFIADWSDGKDIEAVWSSDYRRTRNTAMPLADRLGLETNIYDPRSQAALVEKLTAAKVNAVVVGHSNTIPELASMLCECEVAPMEDTDYERSFVIIFVGGHTGITEPDMKKLWTDRPGSQP